MLSINSDNLVSCNALFDSYNGVLVTDATVTANLIDPNTSAVLAAVVLTGGPGGNYSGLLSAAQTATLAPGATYIIEVSALTASGGRLTDRQQHTAQYVST